MTPNFLNAFNYLKFNEGGFSNDLDDSGGPTMKGVTLEEYSRWLQRPVSIDELKKITDDHVHRIYFQWYWVPMGLNHVINSDVATAIFDQGVNRGTRTVIKAVQGIVGVEQDGHVGPKTLAAINNFPAGPAKLIEEISAQAECAYKQIVARKPSQVVFLKGWLNRAKRLLKLKGEK
jgi:lysozyme family protein